MNTKKEVSAGGVIFKREGKDLLWLICKHSGYHKWALPKGIVEPGENIEDTALREVKEESGVITKIIQKLPKPETYVYTLNNVRIFKTVHYFLMEYISGDIQDHDFEMEDIMWAEYEQAYTLLAFPGAKQTLKTAYELVNTR